VISKERRDALDQRVLEDIAEHGWSDMAIFPTKEGDGPPFNYTVGFKLREHPELLIMGLNMETMHGLLGVIYEQVKSGTRFNPDTYYQFVIENHRVAFVEITDPFGEYPMTMTRHLMGEFQALQLVWPDAQDRFPWHEDFDPEYRLYQELLGPWRGEDAGSTP
jgi:hypothetical protein